MLSTRTTWRSGPQLAEPPLEIDPGKNLVVELATLSGVKGVMFTASFEFDDSKLNSIRVTTGRGSGATLDRTALLEFKKRVGLGSFELGSSKSGPKEGHIGSLLMEKGISQKYASHFAKSLVYIRSLFYSDGRPIRLLFNQDQDLL